MSDQIKRQPKGIPTGGEFAANAHDEASAGLASDGWNETSPSSGFPRFERTVVNPAGTAKYRVWVEDSGSHVGDVYVELTDLSDGRKGSFRSFSNGVDEISSTDPIRIHQAPPLLGDSPFSAPASILADFDAFPDDREFVDGLVKKSLARSARVRSAKPILVSSLRAGDMIDFTPIYEDKSLEQGEVSHSDITSAEYEMFVVESVSEDDGMVTVHTDQTSYTFPGDYRVPVEGIHPDYIDDEEDTL